MSTLPKANVELIEFCEVHAPIWAANASAIGLSPAQVAVLSTRTEEAEGAYKASLSARDASKAATTASNDAIRKMRESAADLLRTIRAFAEASSNPANVYATAQIPPPSAPLPLPPPGRATDLLVTLQPSGAITLAWSAENAAASSGAFYNIFRKVPGQATFVTIGGAPGTTSQSRRMTFTDSNVPTSAAAAGVQYIIQGQRGTQQGLPTDAVVVQFGTDTPGGFSVTGAQGVKLAA